MRDYDSRFSFRFGFSAFDRYLFSQKFPCCHSKIYVALHSDECFLSAHSYHEHPLTDFLYCSLLTEQEGDYDV